MRTEAQYSDFLNELKRCLTSYYQPIQLSKLTTKHKMPDGTIRTLLKASIVQKDNSAKAAKANKPHYKLGPDFWDYNAQKLMNLLEPKPKFYDDTQSVESPVLREEPITSTEQPTEEPVLPEIPAIPWGGGPFRVYDTGTSEFEAEGFFNRQMAEDKVAELCKKYPGRPFEIYHFERACQGIATVIVEDVY